MYYFRFRWYRETNVSTSDFLRGYRNVFKELKVDNNTDYLVTMAPVSEWDSLGPV